MIRNEDIWNELKALDSPLAGMPWQAPYAVPDGYFKQLATALAQGVLFSESPDPAMDFLSKESPFAAPENYFAGLAESLLNGAREGRIAQGIGLPYKAPDGYIEALPATLLQAAKTKTADRHARTVAFRPQWQRVMRFAAAAVLVLGIGLGAYRYTHPASAEKIAAKQLSKVNAEAINAYVEQHIDDYDDETLEASAVAANMEMPASISTLDASEIQDYLEETGEAGGKSLN